MRYSNTFWLWKTSITSMPFFYAKSTFRKPLPREWTKYGSPHPLPLPRRDATGLQSFVIRWIYMAGQRMVRVRLWGPETCTWAPNTFHVAISHPPHWQCLDSSSLLIHWPSVSRALVCAEHIACCYSSSARRSSAPGSLVLLLSPLALQTQALTLSTNWRSTALCKSVKLILILLCVKAPTSYQERKSLENKIFLFILGSIFCPCGKSTNHIVLVM